MGSVTVTVLGPVSIQEDGIPVDLGKPQARLVLAHLLSQDGLRLSRDELIERIWPDRDPRRAGHSLSVHVSELRKRLPRETEVETTSDGYRLRIPDDTLDRDRFVRLVEAGALAEAIDVWSGRAFEGLSGRPGIDQAAASLEARRREVVATWAAAELASGRTAGLVERLEALLDADPFDEKLCGLLMRAHYASGAPAKALEAFRRIKRILGEELGIEPAPELRDLEEQVLLHDSRLPRTGRPEASFTRLPVERTRIIGREHDLTGVMTLLEGAHIVSVVGPGGAGKTRLALRVAHQLVGDGSDVFFVELGSIGEPDRVIEAIIASMGVSDTRGASAMDVLLASVASTETTFVLDNCEHLIEGVARTVDQLLRSGSPVRVLATSREPLGVDGESIWRLAPLEVAPPGAGQEGSAFQLFVERARSQVPDFDPDPHLDDIAELVRRIDGLPLAIELAAALVLHMTPGEITRALDDGVDILDHGSRTAPPRHRSIEDTLAWSEQLMSNDERSMFHRLSVFAGRFGLGEAASVFGLADEGSRTARRLLARLIEKSLVVADTSAEETSFHLLETVRAVGRSRLASAGEESETFERYATHYHRQAREYGWMAGSHRRDEALRWAGRELDNVADVVMRLYRAGEIERPLQIAAALARVITALGRYRTVVDWIELGLDAARSAPVDPDVVAAAQVVMTMAGAERAGSTEAGEAAFRHFADSGNHVGAARAAFASTNNASLTRDLAAAARWSARAVEHARASGSDPTLAWVLPTNVVYRLGEAVPDFGDDDIEAAISDLDAVGALITGIDNAELTISLAIARVTVGLILNGRHQPLPVEHPTWVSDTPYYLPVIYDLARAAAAIEARDLETALELLVECAETAPDALQLEARRASLAVYAALAAELGHWELAAQLFGCCGREGPMIVFGLYFDADPYRRAVRERLGDATDGLLESGAALSVDGAIERFVNATSALRAEMGRRR